MPEDKSKTGSQDRKGINVDQPYEPRAEAKCNLPERRRRQLQRITQALGVAILAFLPMSWAPAQYLQTESSGVHKTAPEVTTTGDSAVDMSVAPVIIEAERLYPERPLDNAERRLHDALGPAPILIASERQFTDGSTEVTTRFGRFCANPLPQHLQPRIGGSVTLAARCASY